MSRIAIACVLAPCALALAGCATAPAKPTVPTVEVESRGVKLQVPESWKKIETTSKFRAFQFEIAATEQGGESAELVIYHFGGPTGGAQANVSRWVGQFHEKGRTVQLVEGKSALGDYVLAEISGTWKKPDGPPFARKTLDKPGSRVIGVILKTVVNGKDDYLFFKFGGPDALIAGQAAALRASFGADASTEKPYQLLGAVTAAQW